MTKEEVVENLKYQNEKFFGGQSETLNMAIKALSVPERKTGEWIAYDHGWGLVYLRCPFCGSTIDKRYAEHNFCGGCGAKLSGEIRINCE